MPIICKKPLATNVERRAAGIFSLLNIKIKNREKIIKIPNCTKL